MWMTKTPDNNNSFPRLGEGRFDKGEVGRGRKRKPFGRMAQIC